MLGFAHGELGAEIAILERRVGAYRGFVGRKGTGPIAQGVERTGANDRELGLAALDERKRTAGLSSGDKQGTDEGAVRDRDRRCAQAFDVLARAGIARAVECTDDREPKRRITRGCTERIEQ